MAKRKSKKRHGRRRKGYVFTAARRRALKKAQRARKRKHGGKRKRKHGGRRKRRHSRKHSSKRRRHSGGGVRHGAAYDRAYAEAVRRGRSPAMAAKIAARVARMKAGSVRRHFEREAVQAKSSAQLANLFAGFGAAGHLAHQARG